jgi:hypothetical protein
MKRLLLISFLAISCTTFAQRLKVVEGSLRPLKGEQNIATDFTYNDMVVGKEYTEEEYIKRKKEDYDKKEPGRGDKWEKAWIADRKERFEPKFKELFEKHSKLTVTDNAKYTLIFHTTRTEPGWNVGVMRVPARIDGEIMIVETSDPGNVIARLTIANAPGQDAWGYDYDTGLRLQEAYAKSGKEIGKLIVKEAR